MNQPVRMPAVFAGHGSPMNAITDTRFSRAWKELGSSLPRPRAVAVVSAHWFVPGTAVTANEAPKTIHDFGGFPKALFDVRYPAPGDPALAADIVALLAPTPVRLDSSWGFDHGAWSVLVHMYPKADIPVIEISVDSNALPAAHFDLGRRLAPLRDRGVLVVACGNIVHNLEHIDFQATEPFDWAVRFDSFVKQALEARDDRALVDYASHPDARRAAPDEDHFYPLLYAAGIRLPDDNVRFFIEGFDAGSISMRGFTISAS
jgi:4,5-DOPA dioxygenase extradiol